MLSTEADEDDAGDNDNSGIFLSRASWRLQRRTCIVGDDDDDDDEDDPVMVNSVQLFCWFYYFDEKFHFMRSELNQQGWFVLASVTYVWSIEDSFIPSCKRCRYRTVYCKTACRFENVLLALIGDVFKNDTMYVGKNLIVISLISH